MDHSDISILIPAYKPDERLNDLLRDLMRDGFKRIVVVNDGSDELFAPHFDKARDQGAQVFTHEENKGKGAALKTGIEKILGDRPTPVITADADGQHTPTDIRKIADAMLEHPSDLILGIRDRKEMPLRSKFGNSMTAFFFGILTGNFIHDTQTGLRGLPVSALEACTNLEGNRYEYEMNMLIALRHMNVPIYQVPIHTVYFDNNRGSHFRSVRDGARVYYLMFRQALAFMGSSLAAGIVEYAIYGALQMLFPQLLFLAVALARTISATMNFLINRKIVFRAQRDGRALLRYALLVCFMMCASYYLIMIFQRFGMQSIPAKVLADFLLFFLNYHIQQSFIFRRKD